MNDVELIFGFVAAAALWSAWLIGRPAADFSHFAVDGGELQWQTR